MVKFPERYKLPKLLKKKFFLNNYVSIKETEFLVKNLSNKKQNKTKTFQAQMASLVNSYINHIKNKLHQFYRNSENRRGENTSQFIQRDH